MRALSYLAVGFVALVCGCISQSQVRANYVRSTLPYESACLVRHAEKMRRDYPDVRISLVNQLIIEHALRLHICLSDPHVSEKDKSNARYVLPQVVSYIATNNVGSGFKSGKEYEMLPNDFVLPPKMRVRDVLDELIQNRR